MIAEQLTSAINDLFFNPRARLTREELRDRTTVHFVPYAEAELFIGGHTPLERNRTDVTIELSDWSMPVRQQRRVARSLTLIVADLFAIAPEAIGGINIRFHPYPPTDFAIGGSLLSDMIPPVGRFMKRMFGR